MSDLEKILLTAAVTIFGGAFVFVFGQLVSRFLIEPWHEQRKVIGWIAESLLGYWHLFKYSAAKRHPKAYEAGVHLRSLAAALMARTVAVPGYSVLACLGLAPRLSRIRKA